MEFRKLGRTELSVSPLCFGGNVFGWTVDEATSFSLLDRFVDAGFNFIDTADVYSAWAPGNVGGESETIIGNWLKSRGLRDRWSSPPRSAANWGLTKGPFPGLYPQGGRCFPQAAADGLHRSLSIALG